MTKDLKIIIRRNKLNNANKFIVQLVSHLGSIMTIFSLYYFKNGSFEFQPKSFLTWIITLLILLIIYSGVKLFLKDVHFTNNIKVTNKELSIINNHYWNKASTSILILGGDISWIKNQIDILIKIKADNQDKRIVIYYNMNSITEETKKYLKRLSDNDIKILSYPKNLKPSLRCLLIDREDTNNLQLISFEKYQAKQNLLSNEDTLYNIEIYNNADQLNIKLIDYLLTTFETLDKQIIKIGITGANNVGKTSIAKGLTNELNKEFRTLLINDAFREVGENTKIHDNLTALLIQVMNLFNSDYEIVIYDRTPADTLAFLNLFDIEKTKLYSFFAPRISKIMEQFDFIFDIQLNNETFELESTLVDAKSRKIVRETLNKFYKNSNLPVIQLFNDTEDMSTSFSQNIEKSKNIIRDKILKITLPNTRYS